MPITTRFIILLFLSSFIIQPASTQDFKRVHHKAIVADTHNDFLMKAVDKGMVFDQDLTGKTHGDLARLRKGGVDVQLFSVYCDGDKKNPYAYAMRAMDSLDAIVARNPGVMSKASDYPELKKALRRDKLVALLGVEGGHMIEDDLRKLDTFFRRGTRYLTLTHNIAPSWATSAADETSNQALPQKGLTAFGRQVVERMNLLGMIIDVSHAGEQTFRDVIKYSTKPIMASHSSVYQLTPHRRNLKDDQIRAIAENGGVIQVNFNPGFIDSLSGQKETIFFEKHKAEYDSLMKTGMGDFYSLDYLFAKYKEETNSIRPALSSLIDHIDYIVKLVGIDYAGLGSDFDGINFTPLQLDDVTTYPQITKALKERGYRKKDIRKILGGNFLRVLKANEGK